MNAEITRLQNLSDEWGRKADHAKESGDQLMQADALARQDVYREELRIESERWQAAQRRAAESLAGIEGGGRMNIAQECGCTALEQCTDVLQIVIEGMEDERVYAQQNDPHAGFYVRNRMGLHLSCLNLVLTQLLDAQRGIE